MIRILTAASLLLALMTSAALVAAVPSAAVAQEVVNRTLELERQCKSLYPSFWEYFDRTRCIEDGRKELAEAEAKRKQELAEAEAKRKQELAEAEAKRKQELAEAEAKRKQELAKAEEIEAENRYREKLLDAVRSEKSLARECYGEWIETPVKLIRSVKSKLHEKMSLGQVKEVVGSLDIKLKIVRSSESIKEKVIVFSVQNDCEEDLSQAVNNAELDFKDYSFRYLVNINFSADGTLKRFGVWAENPPKGISPGWQGDLAVNFAAKRARLAKERAEAEKKERYRKAAEQAARERELESQRKQREKNMADEKSRREAAKRQQKRRERQELLAKNDHCAVGITRAERIRRLGLRGPVREGILGYYIGRDEISPLHKLMFYSSKPNRVMSCH